jgi:hypothetical protein
MMKSGAFVIAAALAAGLPSAPRAQEFEEVPAAVAEACKGIDPILAGSAFVLLRSPAAGERVASGAVAYGCSRTHEGSIAWRLLGRDGRELGSGSASGGGFAGASPFGFTFAFDLALAERGTLEVFEPRATNEGFPPPTTSIPIVLAAATAAVKPGSESVPRSLPAPAASAAPTAILAPPPPSPPSVAASPESESAELPLFARYLGGTSELLLYGQLEAGARRFVLREVDAKGGGAPRETNGSWIFGIGSGKLANAIVVRLEPTEGAARAYRVDKTELVRLGSDDQEIPSSTEPRLVRQR